LMPQTAHAAVCTPGKPCLSDTAAPVPPISTVPADLLAAMQTVEADRALLVARNDAVEAATRALQNASNQAAAIKDKFGKDKAAENALHNKYYPPDPTPTPSPEPTPQPTPAPTPAPTPQPAPNPPAPPVKKLSLVLITDSSGACKYCDWVKQWAVPSVKASLGDSFREIEYTTAEANSIYPDTQVPRWLLTKNNGTVEKKVGAMTPEAIKAWVNGAQEPGAVKYQ
jgi:hypothetical protein